MGDKKKVRNIWFFSVYFWLSYYLFRHIWWENDRNQPDFCCLVCTKLKNLCVCCKKYGINRRNNRIYFGILRRKGEACDRGWSPFCLLFRGTFMCMVKKRCVIKTGTAEWTAVPQIINKVSIILWGCMKGPQLLHMKSAAATCAFEGSKPASACGG